MIDCLLFSIIECLHSLYDCGYRQMELLLVLLFCFFSQAFLLLVVVEYRRHVLTARSGCAVVIVPEDAQEVFVRDDVLVEFNLNTLCVISPLEKLKQKRFEPTYVLTI